MSEYLEFKIIRELPKTKLFSVMSKSSGEVLGRIGWYPQWRQYVFNPCSETIYSAGCLKDIKDFIDKLAYERYERKLNNE
jgi:hypothetical protein